MVVLHNAIKALMSCLPNDRSPQLPDRRIPDDIGKYELSTSAIGILNACSRGVEITGANAGVTDQISSAVGAVDLGAKDFTLASSSGRIESNRSAVREARSLTATQFESDLRAASHTATTAGCLSLASMEIA